MPNAESPNRSEIRFMETIEATPASRAGLKAEQKGSKTAFALASPSGPGEAPQTLQNTAPALGKSSPEEDCEQTEDPPHANQRRAREPHQLYQSSQVKTRYLPLGSSSSVDELALA